MLAGDSRDRWDPGVLDDDRVTHWWDEERATGLWFAEHARAMGLGHVEIVWDTFLVFDGDVRWEGGPPRPVAWGASVIEERAALERALEPLLGAG
jgi:hypothetical protein